MTIHREAAIHIKRVLAVNGLPTTMKKLAKSIGLSNTALETLRDEVVAAPASKLANTSLPGLLADPAALGATREDAKVLRGFASRVRQNPTAPAE